MTDLEITAMYQTEKARLPRYLLLFRIGDFYEMFFDDAEVAHRSLGLTLTTHNKGKNPIKMAGFMVVNGPSYIARLLRMGYLVATPEVKI